MKTLLINPPQSFYKSSQICVEQLPLGTLYIASVLGRKGLEVEVLDALREGDNLTYEDENMQYGLPWQEIAQRIKNSRPDIVGISNPYSCQIENAVMVANITKDIDSNIVTVLGGIHPTVAATDLMNEHASIDICIRGEGEYVMRDLIIDYFAKRSTDIKNIPGLTYRQGELILTNEKQQQIEDLDNIPFPDYEMLDMGKYLSSRYKLKPRLPLTTRIIEMITSRGCPFNCIFCSVRCVMGTKFRGHSPEYVLEHIRYVINKYNVKYIRFNDDNISLDRRRFEAIVSGIIKYRLKIRWSCPNGIRADTLDESLLKKMKKSGCEHIFIAAESGNQEVVNKVIGKNIDLERVEEALRLCNRIGIQADVYFILGLPGETLDNMHQTKRLASKFLAKYNAIPYFFIATPLPGTKLLKICQENNYLTEKISPETLSVTTQGEPVIRTKEFTTDEVKTIFKAASRNCNIIRKIKNIILLFTDPFLFFKKVSRRLKIIIKENII